MNPPRRELGWPLAGLFAASVVAWLVAANHLNQISDRSVHGPHWYLGLALGALLIACGAVVWRRRPDTPIGIRMVIAGFLVFAEVLLRSNDSWLFTVGDLVAGASAALFAHIVLTYPSGRCETELEKVMVTSGYVTVGALCIARATTTNFGPTCPDCPVNRLYIGGYPRLFNAVNAWSAVLVAAFAVGATAALLAKWRRAGPAGRRVLAPTYASALLVLATLLIVRPHLDTRSPRPGDDALDWVTLTLPSRSRSACCGGILPAPPPVTCSSTCETTATSKPRPGGLWPTRARSC